MVNQDWAKVLRFLYQNNGHFTASLDSENADGDDHYGELKRRLADNLNLDAEVGEDEEVHQVINDLAMNDLIEEDLFSTRARIRLLPDGFEVAHERELANEQGKTNHALAILTFALVVAEVVTSHPNPDVYEAGSVGLMVALLYLLFRTDLLENPFS